VFRRPTHNGIGVAGPPPLQLWGGGLWAAGHGARATCGAAPWAGRDAAAAAPTGSGSRSPPLLRVSRTRRATT